ncbi:hypothetical protein [Roseivirga sp.]|uniref:hypothetical protein n=1 Tax=Roseivirga sp. TaxID=1964215 RepID=UPI003B51A364
MKLAQTTMLACLCLWTINVSAQDLVSKSEINEKYTIAGDYIRMDDYKKALPSLHWLLKNAPDFSESVQSWAMDAFEEVANATEDKTRKQVMLDSMLIAYELKAQHFELSVIEQNKLAFRYYKYFLNDKDKLTRAYTLFTNLFDTPDEVINNNLIPFILVTEKYHQLVQNLSEKEIIDNYMLTSGEVTERYFSKNEKRFDNYTAYLDQSLINMLGGEIPCNTIDQMADGMSKSDSVNVAKKVMAFSLRSSCGKTDSYLSALKLLARNEPTSGIFKILAQYEATDDNFGQAISYYQSALELETVVSKKADIHMDIAKMHFANLNKPLARASALESVALNPELGPTAYTFIGHLYVASFDECADRYDIVQDRAVYLAAYDMFAKANNTKAMEEIALQFPTREAAFEQDIYDGDPIKVGCWINVKTTLRTRVSN